MPVDDALIRKLSRQVQAILTESRSEARTGRMRPDLGRSSEGPLSAIVDHTLLKPEATARQIEMLCLEAKEYGFASVCVNSVFVPLALELLNGSSVKVCTVVGFPLGASLPQVKEFEAREALQRGAQEIDMVIHVGALKHRDLVAVFEDIGDVVTVCHDHDAVCKVIIETSLLTEEEKILACLLAKRAGADFIKTSTGFNGGGATVEDITLMRAIAGDGMGVKASGGVRDLATAQAMVQAGANRIGTSSGVSIARQEQGEAPNTQDARGY
jgi:deoxyribose-phosphate aldolase